MFSWLPVVVATAGLGKVVWSWPAFFYSGLERLWPGLRLQKFGRCFLRQPARFSKGGAGLSMLGPVGARFCITGETFCTRGRSLGSSPWSLVVVPFVGPSVQGFILRGETFCTTGRSRCSSPWSSSGRQPLGARFCITGETFCITGRSLGSSSWSSVVVRVAVVVRSAAPRGQVLYYGGDFLYYGEESGVVALVVSRRPGRHRPVVGPSGRGFVLRGRFFVLRGGVWARRLGRRSSFRSSSPVVGPSGQGFVLRGNLFVLRGGVWARRLGRRSSSGSSSSGHRPLGARFCITGETFCILGRSLGSSPWSSVVVRVVVVRSSAL